LREAISEETAFVSIQMVNSEIGTIQAIRELAKEIRHVTKEPKIL
jgi:cysteine sulfinate desulfinase/cysteine desulfurase-like protein